MAADLEVTRLINNAYIRCPGATLPTLQLELFNTMDEFFKASNVWKEDIPVPVPGNDLPGTIYILASNEPATIDKLMWVKFDDGTPVSGAMEIPGELTIFPQPSSDKTVIATVALTVQDPINRDGYVAFPQWVIQKYNDVILDGLLGKMMTQPNKPWTNNQMSVFHMRSFARGKAQARVDGTRNNTYRQQAWRFPGFAGGSQRR